MPASEADAASVNLNGIKLLLGYDLVTFFIKDNPDFSNGTRNLLRNPPDCIYHLDNWVFDSIILADKLLTKALQKFVTCLSVNKN